MIWQTPTSEPPSAQATLADRILTVVPRVCADETLAGQFRVAEAASGVAAYLATPGHGEVPDTSRLCGLLADALEVNGDRALACRIRAFGSAVVYRANWHAAPGEPVWVVNVGRLIEPDEKGMELLLFERLRLLIEAIAGVWDTAAGHGILGLRDLRGASVHVVGRETGERRIEAMSETLRQFCVDRLALLKERRAWDSVPSVMSLHS